MSFPSGDTSNHSLYVRMRKVLRQPKRRVYASGGQKKEKPSLYYQVKSEWEQNLPNSREAAVKLGISHTTFLNWIKSETA